MLWRAFYCPMKREFSTKILKTGLPSDVLVADAFLPHGQLVCKRFERALKKPAVVASAGLYDTDAVELEEGKAWVSFTFRIYQWRLVQPLGLNVEPWVVATVAFHPKTWEEAYRFCLTLVEELNTGNLSETAARLLYYVQERNSTVAK
jgi:hypothetical protein